MNPQGFVLIQHFTDISDSYHFCLTIEADVIIGYPLPCSGRAACLSAVGSHLIRVVPGGDHLLSRC